MDAIVSNSLMSFFLMIQDLPGLEQITDALRQPGGLQSIMQNPDMLAMAQKLYSNQKVQNMMKNPAVVNM